MRSLFFILVLLAAATAFEGGIYYPIEGCGPAWLLLGYLNYPLVYDPDGGISDQGDAHEGATFYAYCDKKQKIPDTWTCKNGTFELTANECYYSNFAPCP